MFLGGWTLEAAEAVCAGEPVEEWQTLDLLTSLTDKSLVVYQQTPAPRYRLLETVRQYARDRLLEIGEGELSRDRHLEYFTTFAETAEPELKGPQQKKWLDWLEAEHDNLRAALEWSIATPNGAEAGLRLCGAVWRFWYVRGHFSEGLDRCASVLSRSQELLGHPRASGLNGAGVLSFSQGNYGAARTLFEESLAIWRGLGDRQGVAMALGNLGGVAYAQGEYEAMRVLIEESLAIRRELDDRHGIALALGNLGIAAKDQGDYGRARMLLEESLAIRRDLDDRHGIASSLGNLGIVALEQGDYGAARAFIERNLAILRELGERLGIAWSMECLASVAGALGNPCRAAQFFGAAEKLREELNIPLPPIEKQSYEAKVAAVRTSLGDVEFDSAWAEGRAMPTEEAISLALSGDR